MLRRSAFRWIRSPGSLAVLLLFVSQLVALAMTTRPRLPKVDWGFLARLDLLPAAVVVAGLLNLLLAWWLVHPRSFRRMLVDPRHRRKLVRWYTDQYFTVMEACGLSRQRNGVATTASLLRVQLGPLVDRLLIGLMVGQSTTDIEGASDRLAPGFGAQSARVFVDGPNTVWLELAHGDALAEVIPPLPIAMTPNFDQVPIEVRADGCVWTLPVLGSHCFIAGATGSGKGSVIWSMLRGLAGPIHDGTAQVWAVDPKGGMELGLARGLFTRFAATNSDEMCELLEDAVDVMDARCARLAGRVRAHQPSTTEPLILVLVDELASLTAYEQDRKLRDRATAALSKLLTKGRGGGHIRGRGRSGSPQGDRQLPLPVSHQGRSAPGLGHSGGHGAGRRHAWDGRSVRSHFCVHSRGRLRLGRRNPRADARPSVNTRATSGTCCGPAQSVVTRACPASSATHRNGS